jgi:hypothetical protein
VHLRLPSIAPGVAALLWGLGLGLYVWIGLLAIGTSGPVAFILGLLSAGAIFLLVRRFGTDGRRAD